MNICDKDIAKLTKELPEYRRLRVIKLTLLVKTYLMTTHNCNDKLHSNIIIMMFQIAAPVEELTSAMQQLLLHAPNATEVCLQMIDVEHTALGSVDTAPMVLIFIFWSHRNH